MSFPHRKYAKEKEGVPSDSPGVSLSQKRYAEGSEGVKRSDEKFEPIE